MNFAFYVSNKSTRLIRFLMNKENNYKHCSLVMHSGDESHELIEICKHYNIKYNHIRLDNVSNKNLYLSDVMLDALQENNIDYVFCFGDRILKGELLDIYDHKIINFHPSILPSFKGLMAIDQALINSCMLLGNTAHFVDKDVDTGLIIMQSILPKQKYSKYDDLLDMQIPMLEQIILWVLDYRLNINKNHVLIEGATYNLCPYIPNLEFSLS